MGIREDLLFGEIALTLQLVTPQQLQECVEIQEREKSPRQLGMILLVKGYLTEISVERILEEQQKNLTKFSDHSQNKQRSLLFGQVAMRQGYLTQSQLIESIREQAKIEQIGIFMHLGEIFVKKNFMTETQVQEVLKEQQSLIKSLQNEES